MVEKEEGEGIEGSFRGVGMVNDMRKCGKLWYDEKFKVVSCDNDIDDQQEECDECVARKSELRDMTGCLSGKVKRSLLDSIGRKV